jgi:hypothetical protein
VLSSRFSGSPDSLARLPNPTHAKSVALILKNRISSELPRLMNPGQDYSSSLLQRPLTAFPFVTRNPLKQKTDFPHLSGNRHIDNDT